ncbi:MAG: hypothetical protein AAFR33_03680, partial [Pseudomonadota bacterium]
VRVNVNQPLDPAGVIYDADTLEPIEGATATLLGPDGAPLPDVCFVDASQQNQVTGSNGFYQFFVVPGADEACPVTETLYELQITLPDGSQPVYAFQPERTPLDATTCEIDAVPGLICEVNASNQPPAALFFDTFLIESGDRDIVHNHIPVAVAASASPVSVTKTTRNVTATTGSVIAYTITVMNDQAVDIRAIDIADTPPAAFTYVVDSARIGGVAVEPRMDGARLIWDDLALAAGETLEIDLAMVVGAGATVGDYVNLANALDPLTGQVRSNVAEARVRIVPDELFDCSEVIGQVFVDTNGNGVQNEGEPGLAGVRVATVQGLLITTDEFGRYSIPCAATPADAIGSNFIVKLDERSLPSGFEMTSENPRVIRLTQGKMSEANFGVAAPRIVELVVTDNVVTGDGETLREEFSDEIDQLIEVLLEAPSLLTLIEMGEAPEGQMALVRRIIEERWDAQGGSGDLMITMQRAN